MLVVYIVLIAFHDEETPNIFCPKTCITLGCGFIESPIKEAQNIFQHLDFDGLL